ncbi:alpha/beta fold hydrolase [Streptomyces actuosus]|uniref:thioesterase domain-containing protein n=1 Tax=Streptomyces actuosus TaxID=1885 RepID=UPI0034D5CA6F
MLHEISAEHPVYALQARGMGGDKELPRRLEDMAADYVARIREVQPSGPYHLLGWSFGGVVAHAMAVQLRKAGEEWSCSPCSTPTRPSAARRPRCHRTSSCSVSC